MSKTYLFDTCVWRDFYEGRFGRTGTPLVTHAAKAFAGVIKNKDRILFSDAMIAELKKRYDEVEISAMLQLLHAIGVVTRIETGLEETLEARQLSQKRGLPYTDCLFAVQARNHQAIVVTQDRHFQELFDIAQIMGPEEVD